MSFRAPQYQDIEDASSVSSSGESFFPDESYFSRHRRSVTGVLGAMALVACGALAFASHAAASPRPEDSPLSVRSLLESPEIHRVATENILKADHRLRGDAAHVHSVVKGTFDGISKHMADHSPELARSLGEIPVTPEQKEAVLHMMSYLSDPRVQRMGLKVAQAVRDARSDDPEVLKKHIGHKLQPHLEHMQQLSKEVFPASVRRQLTGGGFEHLLEPHRIRLMKTVDDSWDAQLSKAQPDLVKGETRRLDVPAWAPPTGVPATPAAAPAAPTVAPVAPGAAANVWGAAGHGVGGPGEDAQANMALMKAEQGTGIAGAAAAEALALLRIMKPLAKVFHNDLNVSPWVTSGIGAGATLLEVVSCELNAAADGTNPVEIVACPMEFGSEFFDSAREAMTLTGILGDNNPENGKQGNHNDDPTIHQGIFDDDSDDKDSSSKPLTTKSTFGN